MTPEDLIERCDLAIAHPLLGGDDAKITLVVKGRWGSLNRRRFAGKGSPLGEIICDGPDGFIFVVFSAHEMKQYVEARK
jgi:hypothetical protein